MLSQLSQSDVSTLSWEFRTQPSDQRPQPSEGGTRTLKLQEQIIEDPVTGLTFQLDAVPESEVATYRIRITGNVTFGNRDIYFDKTGELSGMGTAVQRRFQAAGVSQADMRPEPIEGRMLKLREQVIEDCVTGLTFCLEAVPDSAVAAYHIRITSELPVGNRDICFDSTGKLSGLGTAVQSQSQSACLSSVAA